MYYEMSKLDEARLELVRDEIEDMGDYEIVDLWNEYQQANRYEDELFTMDTLDDYFSGCGATEILDQVTSGFSTSADFYHYTIYGLESVDYYDDVVDTKELAKWVYENGGAQRIRELRDIMERFEEEDELAERIAEAVYEFDPYIGLTQEEIAEAHKLDFTNEEYRKVANGLRDFAAQYEDDENADVSEFIELAEEVEGLA